MPTAGNARLQMEAGEQLTSMVLLTDSGDQKIFTAAAGLWSGVATFEPVVRPNGVRSGLVVTPTTVNDEVQTSAGEVNLNGVITTVGADASTIITRTAAGGTFQINSITVNAAGAVVNVVGTEGTAFSETRAAAGGPPLIPVDSIEIAQVRTSSDTAAVIKASEIFAVPGTHLERADFPLFTVNSYKGQIEYIDALPKSHTGTVPKRNYAQYYTPIFTNVPEANTVVLPEATYTQNSTPTYDGPRGSVASALGQGSFTALLSSGIKDFLIKQKGKKMWWKFFPDKNLADYHAVQAILGTVRQFPADAAIAVSCTLSAEKEGTDVEV